MESKGKRALKILNNRGYYSLTKTAYRYLRKEVKQYIYPTKRHIRNLQNSESLVVAEIGVWRGENAERLLNDLDISKLLLIDPYEIYDEYDGRKIDEEVKLARNRAHERLYNEPAVKWIEMYSDQAVSEITLELDYIYIDGNHEYSFVKNDMEEYYPLLKEGGILAGDDVDMDGVARAFVEFAIEKNLQPYLEPHHPEWYFRKGSNLD